MVGSLKVCKFDACGTHVQRYMQTQKGCLLVVVKTRKRQKVNNKNRKTTRKLLLKVSQLYNLYKITEQQTLPLGMCILFFV